MRLALHVAKPAKPMLRRGIANVLVFIIVVLAIATAVVAIVSPSLVKYAAAGLLIIAILLLIVNPDVVPRRVRHRFHT